MQLLGCICQLGLNSNFFVQQGNMLIARLRWELHHWHLKKILLSWLIYHPCWILWVYCCFDRWRVWCLKWDRQEIVVSYGVHYDHSPSKKARISDWFNTSPKPEPEPNPAPPVPVPELPVPKPMPVPTPAAPAPPAPPAPARAPAPKPPFRSQPHLQGLDLWWWQAWKIPQWNWCLHQMEGSRSSAWMLRQTRSWRSWRSWNGSIKGSWWSRPTGRQSLFHMMLPWRLLRATFQKSQSLLSKSWSRGTVWQKSMAMSLFLQVLQPNWSSLMPLDFLIASLNWGDECCHDNHFSFWTDFISDWLIHWWPSACSAKKTTEPLLSYTRCIELLCFFWDLIWNRSWE